MRICVVGGTGHISEPFVRLLLKKGHEVTCFNRGQSGPTPSGALLIQGDRTDHETFEKTIQKQRFDAAIDMICYKREEAESDIRAFQGVKHFIQCSTVATYGVDYDWLPVSEDHPLRPAGDYGTNKAAADHVFLDAYHSNGFPVTIIKPSTTYGPKQLLLRQIAFEVSWIDRIRKGKPILVCGDGKAKHQHLHVDDAALCFANVVEKDHCIGQTYNMVRRGFTTWETYHKTAMKVLGQKVEMVGIPLDDLMMYDVPNSKICKDMFAHDTIFDSSKLFRDVPEFQPCISLEQGMAQVIEALDRENRIPDSDHIEWEDRIIAAQRRVREQ